MIKMFLSHNTQKSVEHIIECWETIAAEWSVSRCELAYFGKCLSRTKYVLESAAS